MNDVSTVLVRGLSWIPAPWVPSEGDIFEGRLRSGDRWYRMRWLGWSNIDPGRPAETCDAERQLLEIVREVIRWRSALPPIPLGTPHL